jgi:protein TonB
MAIDSPNPSYSDEARQAKVEGTVVLVAVVGIDGRAHDIRVSQTVGHGLDEQAIKTLKQRRFKPATSKGAPVPVLVSVQMAFRPNQ